MADVLASICAIKQEAVNLRKQKISLDEIRARARDQEPPRGFISALELARADGRYGLIAEIKRASPSKGLIRPDFDPPSLARSYARGGASCLSVLTEEPHFQGKDEFLIAARAATSLPVLRKDFIVDPWQVYETRAIGADCVLLILAALDDGQARELELIAEDLGLDVLIEVHDQTELGRALDMQSKLIGINSRNLKTLKVDLGVTERLALSVPEDRLLVAESGLSSPDDLARMARVGITTFLIGESLMRQSDVEAATRSLLERRAGTLNERGTVRA